MNNEQLQRSSIGKWIEEYICIRPNYVHQMANLLDDVQKEEFISKMVEAGVGGGSDRSPHVINNQIIQTMQTFRNAWNMKTIDALGVVSAALEKSSSGNGDVLSAFHGILLDEMFHNLAFMHSPIMLVYDRFRRDSKYPLKCMVGPVYEWMAAEKAKVSIQKIAGMISDYGHIVRHISQYFMAIAVADEIFFRKLGTTVEKFTWHYREGNFNIEGFRNTDVNVEKKPEEAAAASEAVMETPTAKPVDNSMNVRGEDTGEPATDPDATKRSEIRPELFAALDALFGDMTQKLLESGALKVLGLGKSDGGVEEPAVDIVDDGTWPVKFRETDREKFGMRRRKFTNKHIGDEEQTITWRRCWDNSPFCVGSFYVDGNVVVLVSDELFFSSDSDNSISDCRPVIRFCLAGVDDDQFSLATLGDHNETRIIENAFGFMVGQKMLGTLPPDVDHRTLFERIMGKWLKTTEASDMMAMLRIPVAYASIGRKSERLDKLAAIFVKQWNKVVDKANASKSKT